tara:strand:- start:3402 stop:3578 length:177 start_codon:yes stop_codon:yes gene_type:complete
MSCIHNEVIKERIMEEVEDMSLHEFQELLDKHNYSGLNDHIDVGIKDMIEILFEERAE